MKETMTPPTGTPTPVKRYDKQGCSDVSCMCYSEMVEESDGTYVKHEDYASLLSRVESAETELRRIEWAVWNDSDHGKMVFCHECRNEKERGHYPGCPVAAHFTRFPDKGVSNGG